jgi:hypothetical protein
MFAYGYGSSIAFNRASSSRNKRNGAIYLLILFGLVLSFGRLYFCSYGYALALPYAALLYKKTGEKAQVPTQSAPGSALRGNDR